MKEIMVGHSRGAYAVRFVSLAEALFQIPDLAVVITDENVFDSLKSHLRSPEECVVVAPGEGSKSVATYENVLRQLADGRVPRSTTIVALGGGVVGDLAGFVAATYMRGVDLVQIPTSLLAMVDSSVGGKVGIDLPEGKNMVGSFFPPSAVWICLEALESLPLRHRINGMAEVLKYGFIMDPELLTRVPHEVSELTQEMDQIIFRCIELKAQVCESDEFDIDGSRATLNFGHTVGHAIEAELRYEELLHGEAVSIGMVIESRIGEAIGATEVGTASRVESELASRGLPLSHSVLGGADRLIDRMLGDKKSEAGCIGMSLVERIGKCKLFPEIPIEPIRRALLEA